MIKNRRLKDEYQFEGFRAGGTVRGIFGDPFARVIKLERRQKKQFVVIAILLRSLFMTGNSKEYEIYPVEENGFILKLKFGEYYVRSAAK